MATRRSGWNELRRLLDTVAVPWFVVDAHRHIVWCNHALTRATELGQDELVHRECRYHTPEGTSRADAIAAALCPPPELDRGSTTTTVVTWLSSSGDEVRYHATFAPLVDTLVASSSETCESMQSAGFLVVVTLHGPLSGFSGDEQTPDAVLLADDPSPSALHNQVRTFRLAWGRRYHVDRLIGSSCHARRIREQVEMASDGKGAVLIVGPEGSGRRHIARAIHYSRGDSRAGRLVHLSATALSPDTLNSAVRGLSAAVDSNSRPSMATLLLAQVDRLPDDLQLQLETLLEDQHPGVRLISTATGRLDQRARDGRFRWRLAMRLDALTIELPPFRERREDIAPIAQLFVEEFNALEDKQLGGFQQEALDQLAAYGWPGEIGELRDVVFEACRRAAAPLIAESDLPRKVAHGVIASTPPREAEETIVLDEFLAQIESEIVRRALYQAKGNKSKAAALLGLTRPRLYRRLVQLGLQDDA